MTGHIMSMKWVATERIRMTEENTRDALIYAIWYKYYIMVLDQSIKQCTVVGTLPGTEHFTIENCGTGSSVTTI